MKETKFKQTEVGMIPSDWEVKTLEEVCQNQGIVRGPFGGALKKEMFVSSGYKVYEQKNAIYKSVDLGQYFVDASKYREMARFSIKPGDFIVSCSGTIGKIFKIPKKAPEGIINQALLKLSVDEEKISSDYFITYFECDNFQSAIIDDTQGGAMKNLVGMDKFRKSLFILPPTIKEQQRIANALSDVDTLINNLEKLIAKKKNIKQGAMQQLLTGRKRLPGFAPAKPTYKQTELGQIPTDWEVKTIKELGVFLGGGTPSTKNESFWKGNIPWISSADLSDDDIEHISMTRFITQEAVNFSATQICPQGTILIIARVGVGKLALSQQKVCTSQDFCNLIPSKENDSKFLAYALLPVMKRMSNESQGTSIKGVAVDEIKKVQIIVPSSKAEQTAIANILSDMDTEIATLETKLAKYRKLKTGMMQQLLTGKIRLVK